MPVASGTSNLYFSRETKVYLKQGVNIWEIPVLADHSYSQANNTSEVTLSEMSNAAGDSRRGRRMFTDSNAPAEWSFSTYARPYFASTRHRAVEEALWANFVAANTYTAGPGTWALGVASTATELTIDFDDSNKTLIGEFELYFVLGGSRIATRNFLSDGDTTIYRIQGCAINEASITFDIDGISTIAWSGMGGSLKEQTSFDASTAIVAGTTLTSNFIRNRITQMAIQSSVSGSSKTYDITLTGGSITITNNLTYLTPEVIGVVNQPLGHVTGTRTVSGNFTAYLDEKTNGTMDLFEDISNALTVITNQFAIDFYIGGKAAGDLPRAPGLQFKMPNVHLNLPSIDNSDVVSVSVDFSALPSNISSTDEISKIVYVGAP